MAKKMGEKNGAKLAKCSGNKAQAAAIHAQQDKEKEAAPKKKK